MHAAPVACDSDGVGEQDALVQHELHAAPATGDGDGVGKQVAASGSFQSGSALPGQQRAHPAEDPDGPLQVHQLVVQRPPLRSLL